MSALQTFGIERSSITSRSYIFENLNFETLSDVRATPLAKSLASKGGKRNVTSKSWSRRRNSIMWTPMPTKYEFSPDAMASQDRVILESDVEIENLGTAVDMRCFRSSQRRNCDEDTSSRIAKTTTCIEASEFRT